MHTMSQRRLPDMSLWKVRTLNIQKIPWFPESKNKTSQRRHVLHNNSQAAIIPLAVLLLQKGDGFRFLYVVFILRSPTMNSVCGQGCKFLENFTFYSPSPFQVEWELTESEEGNGFQHSDSPTGCAVLRDSQAGEGGQEGGKESNGGSRGAASGD